MKRILPSILYASEGWEIVVNYEVRETRDSTLALSATEHARELLPEDNGTEMQ
jgi:hypothetical protein